MWYANQENNTLNIWGSNVFLSPELPLEHQDAIGNTKEHKVKQAKFGPAFIV